MYTTYRVPRVARAASLHAAAGYADVAGWMCVFLWFALVLPFAFVTPSGFAQSRLGRRASSIRRLDPWLRALFGPL
jgi:hypothetical protein